MNCVKNQTFILLIPSLRQTANRSLGQYIRLRKISRVDNYDASTNSCSISVMPQNVGGTIISYNNVLYVTNGNQVWKLEF